MPNSKKIKLSIIIVNYRSELYLDKCLASIYNESDSSQFETIVVNNDAKADLVRMAKKYAKVKIYNRGKNSGFGAACNYGARKSKGEFILFLNPDTQFLGDYVDDIIAKFKKSDRKISIIGPRLITDKGETQAWCAGKDLTIRERIKNKFGLVESRKIWESKDDVLTDWVSGSALAMKKEIFEKVEGFDGKIFMYGEDLDLCAKVRDLGYEILYWPKAAVLHSRGKSRENVFKQKMQYLKSSFYYIKKRLRNKSRN